MNNTIVWGLQPAVSWYKCYRVLTRLSSYHHEGTPPPSLWLLQAAATSQAPLPPPPLLWTLLGMEGDWLALLKACQPPPFPPVPHASPSFPSSHLRHFLQVPRNQGSVSTPPGWGRSRCLHLYHGHRWLAFCYPLRQAVIYFLKHFKATSVVERL